VSLTTDAPDTATDPAPLCGAAWWRDRWRHCILARHHDGDHVAEDGALCAPGLELRPLDVAPPQSPAGWMRAYADEPTLCTCRVPVPGRAGGLECAACRRRIDDGRAT
jgi:hypothetical protein